MFNLESRFFVIGIKVCIMTLFVICVVVSTLVIKSVINRSNFSKTQNENKQAAYKYLFVHSGLLAVLLVLLLVGASLLSQSSNEGTMKNISTFFRILHLKPALLALVLPLQFLVEMYIVDNNEDTIKDLYIPFYDKIEKYFVSSDSEKNKMTRMLYMSSYMYLLATFSLLFA